MSNPKTKSSTIDDELSVEALAEALALEVEDEDKSPGKRGAPAPEPDWGPLLNPTQQTMFNDPSDVVAAYGPKYTGKTIGLSHKVIRHLYENWDALYLILGSSYAALAEGVCYDINSLVLPAWGEGNKEPQYIYNNGVLVPNPIAGELRDGGIGIEFTPWKLDPATKHMYCRVENRFGGYSRIRAMSIPYAKMVEAKIKGPAPSGVYLEEATDTDGKEYYTYPSLQLYRRRDIDGPQQYLLSCNPKKPSWVFDWLWKDCKVSSGGRVWENDRVEPGIRRDKAIAVYFVPYEENKHNVSQKNREILEASLRSDVTLKQRLIDGLWVEQPSGEALFKNEFSDAKHVFGSREKQRGLSPVRGHPIIIGYDTGQVHTGIALMQCLETEAGPFWIVFDELCYYDQRINYRRLTRGLLEKMAYWNRRMEYTFEFRHISDSQATNQWSPNKGSTTARDLADFSREFIEADPKRYEGLQPIRVVDCPKPPGSIEARVEETMNLLHDRQLAVSAMCPWVRGMFLHLVRDKESPMSPARGKYIHTFDGVSYPIYYRRYVQTKGFMESSKIGSAVSVTGN